MHTQQNTVSLKDKRVSLKDKRVLLKDAQLAFFDSFTRIADLTRISEEAKASLPFFGCLRRQNTTNKKPRRAKATLNINM